MAVQPQREGRARRYKRALLQEHDGSNNADKWAKAQKARGKVKMHQQPQVAYLVGAVLVWVGLFAATAVLLGGTPHFGELVPILVGGAFYFVVIVPGGILRTMASPSQPRAPRPEPGTEAKE